MAILKMGGDLKLASKKVGETSVVLLGDLIHSDKFFRMTDVHISPGYVDAYCRAFNGVGVDYYINYVLGVHITTEDACTEMSHFLEQAIEGEFHKNSENGQCSLSERDVGLIADNICRHLIISDAALQREVAHELVKKLYKILEEGNSVACNTGVLQMTNGEIRLRPVVDNV